MDQVDQTISDNVARPPIAIAEKPPERHLEYTVGTPDDDLCADAVAGTQMLPLLWCIEKVQQYPDALFFDSQGRDFGEASRLYAPDLGVQALSAPPLQRGLCVLLHLHGILGKHLEHHFKIAGIPQLHDRH